MAQIPRVGPGSTQLRTESVIPKQSSTAEQNYVDSLGQGLQTIGGAVEKVAGEQYKTLFEARAFTEKNQAANDFTKWQADELLKADSAVDPKTKLPYQGDVANYGYQERLKTKRQELSNYFSDKVTEQEFMAEVDKSGIQVGTQLQKKFTENMIDAGKAAVLGKINSSMQSYITAPNSLQVVNGAPQLSKKLWLDRIKMDIKDAVGRGFIKTTEGQKLLYDTMQTAEITRFKTDAGRNIKETEEGYKNGEYELLDAEGVVKAEQYLKAAKQEKKALSMEQYLNLQAGIIDGSINENTINQLRELNKIDPYQGIDLAQSVRLKKELNSSITRNFKELISTKKGLKKFDTAIDLLFADDPLGKVQAQDAVVEAYTGGEATKDEALFLLKLTGSAKRTMDYSGKTGAIKSSINFVKGLTGAYANADTTQNLKILINKIRDGQDPNLAAEQVAILQMNEDHPGSVVDGKIPSSAYGKNGFSNNPPSSNKPASNWVYINGKLVKK